MIFKYYSLYSTGRARPTLLRGDTMETLRSLDNLSENMRRLRKVKRFSQEELAERTGLHPYSIGLIERKIKSPTLRSVEKISRALEVSVIELVCEPEHLGKHEKCVKDARAKDVYQMMQRLNKPQADRLFGVMKTIVEGFEDARQPMTLKAAEEKSVYRAAKRAKRTKQGKRRQT